MFKFFYHEINFSTLDSEYNSHKYLYDKIPLLTKKLMKTYINIGLVHKFVVLLLNLKFISF